MKIELWSFGKEHESHIREGMSLYSSRLRHYCEFEFRTLHAGKHAFRMTPVELRKQEARVLMALLEPAHVLVALDERGKELTSPQLATMLEKQAMSSKTMVFLIGGAYGLDESVLLKAGAVVSLSKLTFPHQLVRLIMAEQLYRAFTILRHEKYHHQ